MGVWEGKNGFIKKIKKLHKYYVVCYGEFTPISRAHTWYVTALLGMSKKVPWFNFFKQNWYIIYIYRGQFLAPYDTVRHLTTVMYRAVPLSKPYTQKAMWAQSIVTADRCEPGITEQGVGYNFIVSVK